MKRLRTTGMIVMLALLVWSCGSNTEESNQLVRKVKIDRVQEGDTLQWRSFPGVVREAAEVNLAFRVAGPIARIAVREGDYVQAGQLVAQMDRRDYEIQLQAAQAQYDKVKAETERVIELHNRQSVASNEYDKAVTGLRMVEAQLNHARDQLNDTRLLAPISGYIQKVNFRQNELVDTGMPVVTLVDVSHYLVEIDIPVSLYARRNDIVSLSGVQSTLGNGQFPLQLLSINRKASHNQLYRVQLALEPGSQPGLAPGMDMQVNLSLRIRGNGRVCVPLSALFKRGEKTLVWVYMPDQETVVSREVLPGNLVGKGMIQITEGLQAGEQIVVAGVSLINDNEKVQPLAPLTETNIGGLL